MPAYFLAQLECGIQCVIYTSTAHLNWNPPRVKQLGATVASDTYRMAQLCPLLSLWSSPGDDLKFPQTTACPLTSRCPSHLILARTWPSSLCLDTPSFRKLSLNTTRFPPVAVGLVTLSSRFPQGRCLPQVTLHHNHLDSHPSPPLDHELLEGRHRA